MRKRALLSVLAIGVFAATSAFALPKIDAPKEADEQSAWQTKANFAALHGEADGGGFSGYGSYQEARSIIEYAMGSAPSFSNKKKYNHYMRALRDARRSAGDAEKYRRLIDVLIAGAKATDSYPDGAVALRGGCDYLVNGGGKSMTKSTLKLGLSMVQKRMSSYENAYKICFKAVSAAIREAQQENEQWASILRFTKVAADKTGSWVNGYKTMRSICNTVIDAEQGQTVYMRALVNISRAGLNDSKDLYKVMMAGFREYQREVPSKAHQELSRFVVAAAEKAKTWAAGRKIMIAAAEKMQNLGFDSPAAKVLLQAGRDLSGDSSLGTTEDRFNIAISAMRACSRLDIPGNIARALKRGIRDAERARTFSKGLRIARKCMKNLL